MDELTRLRELMDELDDKLLGLLRSRVDLSRRIGELKKRSGMPVRDPAREREVLKRVKRLSSQLGFDPLELEEVFLKILAASRRVQGEEPKVAYLGPSGTFCEQAARKFFSTQPAMYMDRLSIQDVFRSVEWGEADYGVVPVENSLEGSVNITLDMFLETDVKICGEIEERISHCLISKPGVKVEQVKVVYSHPQAIAQCRKFIEANLSEVRIIETSSTAKAVLKAKKLRNAAAIGPELSARIYGMETLARGVEDAPYNYTRFFILSKKESDPTGKDKTSIIFSVPHKPGSLHEALGAFARRHINLTKIESRPARRGSWEYYFYCDFEGHRLMKPCLEALEELRKKCVFLKTLGSYPRA
ncbi:MAG: prephenate dehydratase [Candidatus Bathyarchaeia archaeon]